MGILVTTLTDRVRLVQGTAVNWLIVIDNQQRVLLVDSGYPGDREDVLASLAQAGCTAADLTAILLTHAHIDHLGSAIWFAKTHGTPVYCHPDEVAHVKRDYLQQASAAAIAANMWRPGWLRWAAHVGRSGGATRDGIPTATALSASVAATLPGRPIAVPTPGHTGGHCSYLVDGVLVSGDALVTGHPLAPRSGPQLLPAFFTHDQAGARRSLATLAAVESEILAPGHGPPWRGDIGDAVAQALAG